MFDGSYKSKRVISLSGRSKGASSDKADTLRVAREARKERALNELRRKSSTLIQSLFRSYSTRLSLPNTNSYTSTITTPFNLKQQYILSSLFSLPLPLTPLLPSTIASLPSKSYIYILSSSPPPSILNLYLTTPPKLTSNQTSQITSILLTPLKSLNDSSASSLLSTVTRYIPPTAILATLILAVPNLPSKPLLSSTACQILNLPNLQSLHLTSIPDDSTSCLTILTNLTSIHSTLNPASTIKLISKSLQTQFIKFKFLDSICPVTCEITESSEEEDSEDERKEWRTEDYPSITQIRERLIEECTSMKEGDMDVDGELFKVLLGEKVGKVLSVNFRMEEEVREEVLEVLNMVFENYHLTNAVRPSKFLTGLVFESGFLGDLWKCVEEGGEEEYGTWLCCFDLYSKSKFDEDLKPWEEILKQCIVRSKNILREECEKKGGGRKWIANVAFLRKVRERWERLQFCPNELFVWESQPRLNNTGKNAGLDLTAVADEMDEENKNEDFTAMFRDLKFGRILETVPFCINFNVRYDIFRSLITANQKITHDELESIRAMAEGFTPPSYVRIRVGRERLFLDSLEQLNKLGGRMKNKVQVSFVNSEGLDEAGIDGGGVFKEFMGELVRKGFLDEEYFRETENHDLIPNSLPNGGGEAMEFLGRVLGKAVYENILVEPRFGLIFLKKVLGRTNQADDLRFHDASFFSNLMKLKTPAVDPASLCLDFTITSSTNLTGQHTETRDQELVKGGRNIDVNKGNVLGYIYHVAHHMLNVELSVAVKRFLKGFREIIPASWITMFSPRELQKIIGGDDEGGIDVGDLKKTMVYAGGYHESQPIIVWFWEVVEEFSKDEQAKFLMFITSNSRTPLKGFRALTPVPCIQQVYANHAQGGKDDGSERLPTAATCMNLLKLPKYKDKETLKAKLTYAVMSGAGFELS